MSNTFNMIQKGRYVRPGFETKAIRLAAIDRELRLDTLRNFGHVGTRIVPSKLQKASDPRRQRKTRSWQRDI